MVEYIGVVQVVANVFVKSGEETKFQEIAAKIVAPTRSEDGNVSYNLHQSLNNPSEFVFIETWGSKAALNAHLATTHMAAFFDLVQPLFSAPPVINTYRHVKI